MPRDRYPKATFFRVIVEYVGVNWAAVVNENVCSGRTSLSQTALLNEKRRHIQNYKNIIHPFSNFRYYWDILLIVGMIIILLITPYQAAFSITQETLVPTFIKNSLLLLCCGDMFVNISTGYFDKRRSIVEMERKKIIERYVKHGTFFTDLFGSFPTDVIFVNMWNECKVTRKIVSLLLPIVIISMKQPDYTRTNFWIDDADLWDKPTDTQYFFSLLLTIGNCLRSGFLKNDRRNVFDLYVIIIAQIMGTLLMSLLIVRLMQYMKGTYSSKFKYQCAVRQLNQYMRHKQLPRRTQRRIINYYEFRFLHHYFRESDIINTLSLQLRQEIIMLSCQKLVENVSFFDNLPFALLNHIVTLLKSEIFLTNDVIIRANERGNCMYFIGSGTVAVYTISGKEVCHLEDGAYFGEIALVMTDERRVASVVAVEICKLYRLDRVDFTRTIHRYPMLWDNIKKIAIERHERTMMLDTY
ncbi:potassium/sodium hyperpolarization-activated cyclic nucleotide-gated channel 1-like [Vespa crabro]|uniref:potassium/sodium hyperpolarization-activated cyclic nucleotide-gated channel 1-like n=1 Tax=Vespa crabro TaxID=7445 RepID=UPI001F030856|nr:potassium/sodium hyperpolarization-activated cyclic nucleotide-gated channel 1-like [Vespa crabro]